jgi:hypothetical protein
MGWRKREEGRKEEEEEEEEEGEETGRTQPKLSRKCWLRMVACI